MAVRSVRIPLAIAILLTACTRPLKLSHAPASPGESSVQEVFAQLKRLPVSQMHPFLDSTVAPFTHLPQQFPPSFWAESARTGFRAAMTDLIAHAGKPLPFDSESIAHLRIEIVKRATSDSDNNVVF
jgi:hypothetical protein